MGEIIRRMDLGGGRGVGTAAGAVGGDGQGGRRERGRGRGGMDRGGQGGLLTAGLRESVVF